MLNPEGWEFDTPKKWEGSSPLGLEGDLKPEGFKFFSLKVSPNKKKKLEFSCFKFHFNLPHQTGPNNFSIFSINSTIFSMSLFIFHLPYLHLFHCYWLCSSTEEPKEGGDSVEVCIPSGGLCYSYALLC